jgi:hypothetical protein
MNDDELIMVLREQRGKVPMTTPLEQIISRSRAVRTRRRVPGVAAAVGAAAAVAVAVSVALPASHPAASRPPAGHPASGPGARLAAWTVTRQADGNIQVSFFRQLRDPAGLQRTLRADGVRASVTFIGQENPACQAYPMPANSHLPRMTPHGLVPTPLLDRVVAGMGPGSPTPPGVAMVIHPSLLPSGAGLQISVMRGIPAGPAGPWPYPKGSGHSVVGVAMVKASPQCTGS